MENRLRIKPLLKYEVHQHFYKDGRDVYEVDTITGDGYEVLDNEDGKHIRIRFYRTSNLIREYFGMPVKIVVSPIDKAADIPE
jgi:hypothetical protein